MKLEVLSLQSELMDDGLTACLITSSDYHESEYVNEHFRFRAYVSGFTGSAGTMVVTNREAGLWTDSRYFLQAEKQLEDSDITLFRQGLPGVETPLEYLRRILPRGARLGVDCRTISVRYAKELQDLMKEKDGELVSVDLASEVWRDRPELTGAPVWKLEDEYSGKPASEKLADIRRAMADKGADMHVLCSLDDIAWTLNLRGNDITHTPVFYSYLVLTPSRTILYGLLDAFSYDIREYLAGLNMELHPYEDFYIEIDDLAVSRNILIDPGKMNYEIYRKLNLADKLIEEANPSTLMKAVKNSVEMENLRKANIKDGIAMVNFLYWLKNNVDKYPIDEIMAADHLEKCRREAGAIDLSFGTIAGYGPHAAIVHYSATPESNIQVRPEGLFLVDSGGHYLEGSTDITRTIAVGPLTEEMKLHYTLVLKGMIALASAKFAEGCSGNNLDILAHMPLWRYGLDYGHGTGHGIGYLLGCHEGPQRIHWASSKEPFRPGMLTSDEPGLYIEGSHGIRIENDLLCVEAGETPFGKLLAFETMTLCPIDKEPINTDLLTIEEKSFLNAYHKKVYSRLADGLDEEVAAWLKTATAAI